MKLVRRKLQVASIYPPGDFHGMPTMDIRNVKESDLAPLLELIMAKAAFDGCPNSPKATVDSLRKALFSSNPVAHALVAEAEGQIVGMATYYAIFSSFISKPGLWLDDLFVQESSRNLGIGEALMSRLCSIAAAGSCGRGHVSRSNERGKDYYRRLGATISENERLVRMTDGTILAFAHADTE